VDHARLELYDCTSFDLGETIGPYIRDCIRRDPRFEERLGVSILWTGGCVSYRFSVIGVGYHGPDGLPQQGPPFATFSVTFWRGDDYNVKEGLSIHILTLLPQERVVFFETNLWMITREEIIVAMPNLEALYIVDTVVQDDFLLPNPDGPNAHTKLLPSLQRLYLQDAQADWWPLARYATHQTSGNHAFSLILLGEAIHICPEMAGEMKRLVDEFAYDHDPRCPHRECDEEY